MIALYRPGGYGNAEERPERRIGFAGGRRQRRPFLRSFLPSPLAYPAAAGRPPGNQCAKPRGFGGGAPATRFRRFATPGFYRPIMETVQRMDARANILVELVRRQLCQLPLVAVVVVVIGPVGNHRFDLPKGLAVGQIDLILHVTVEALLRRIVPAVGTAGHRLPQGGVTDDLDESVAGIVATLIAVDQRLCLERDAVLSDEELNRLQHKVDFQGLAHTNLKH